MKCVYLYVCVRAYVARLVAVVVVFSFHFVNNTLYDLPIADREATGSPLKQFWLMQSQHEQRMYEQIREFLYYVTQFLISIIQLPNVR